MSSKQLGPEDQCSNLANGEERGGSFGIASCHRPPLFEVQKCILHQVTQPIQVFVVIAGIFPVAPRRYHRLHSLCNGPGHDGVGVVGPVCQQILGRQVRRQRLGPACSPPPCPRSEPTVPAFRGHQRARCSLLFSPLSAGDGLVTPHVHLPPWGCTLIWLASIINHSKSGSSITLSRRRAQTPRSRQRQNRR